MRQVSDLYGTAQLNNIPVDHFPLGKREALSLMDTDGACYIALDPARVKDTADQRCKLAHELGHCLTGSFYNMYATADNRQRHENKADKWAVEYLIPAEQLDEAIAAGNSELWQLAEYFSVTEDMMRKALCWYVYGNLAAELYF